jgi:hypothetical protein
MPLGSERRFSSLGVPWPVLLIAGLMIAGLLAVSDACGFHGDEIQYFVAGQHPALGYVDPPPVDQPPVPRVATSASFP